MSLHDYDNLRLVNFDGLYINPERVKQLLPRANGGTRLEMTTGLYVDTTMCEAEVREYAGISDHVGGHIGAIADRIVAQAHADNVTLRHEIARLIRAEFPTMPIAEAVALVRQRERPKN